MMNLYKDETLDPSLVSELNRLHGVAKANHPSLMISWNVAHTAMGKAIVKLQILGIESSYLLPDAVAAFKRLAGG